MGERFRKGDVVVCVAAGPLEQSNGRMARRFLREWMLYHVTATVGFLGDDRSPRQGVRVKAIGARANAGGPSQYWSPERFSLVEKPKGSEWWL
jgi:hypothetical protein